MGKYPALIDCIEHDYFFLFFPQLLVAKRGYDAVFSTPESINTCIRQEFIISINDNTTKCYTFIKILQVHRYLSIFIKFHQE